MGGDLEKLTELTEGVSNWLQWSVGPHEEEWVMVEAARVFLRKAVVWMEGQEEEKRVGHLASVLPKKYAKKVRAEDGDMGIPKPGKVRKELTSRELEERRAQTE